MYPDYQIHSTSTIEPGQLNRILDHLTNAGCTLPPAVADAWKHARQAREHIDSTEADLYDNTRVVAEISQKLAAGKGTVQDVERALMVQTMTTKDMSAVVRMQDKVFNDARRQIDSNLRDVMRGHGEAWITETMRPVVTALVQTLRAADIEEFAIDRRGQMQELAPLAAQPHVAEAWRNLMSIYDMAQELRRVRIIPSTMERQDLYEYAGDATERGSLPRNFTAWTYLSRRGHEPGIYTQAEAEQHMADAGIVNMNLPQHRNMLMDEQRRLHETFRALK